MFTYKFLRITMLRYPSIKLWTEYILQFSNTYSLLYQLIYVNFQSCFYCIFHCNCKKLVDTFVIFSLVHNVKKINKVQILTILNNIQLTSFTCKKKIVGYYLYINIDLFKLDGFDKLSKLYRQLSLICVIKNKENSMLFLTINILLLIILINYNSKI